MFCEKCGIKIPEESAFCTKCGTVIENASLTNAAEQPATSNEGVQSTRKKKPIYLVAGIAVVGIIVAVIIFVMSGNPLVGTWAGDGNIEFFRNGRGVWNERDISWRQRGDTIEVAFYHERVWDGYYVERVGNVYTLNLRESRGRAIYRRDRAPVFRDGTYIIGRWDGSMGRFIEFFSDGTGIWDMHIDLPQAHIQWSIENGVITKTWQHESIYQFSLSGNTLTLFYGRTSATFTRLGAN